MTAIETLKQWFSNLKKPTQEQFWAWLDSFWHKSEKIPMASVEGLDKLVEGTASAEQLSNHLKDTQAHKVLFDEVKQQIQDINTILQVDDVTLDTLQEIVTELKANTKLQELIGKKVDKGTYEGTAQDLKSDIDSKADKNHTHAIQELNMGTYKQITIDNIGSFKIPLRKISKFTSLPDVPPQYAEHTIFYAIEDENGQPIDDYIPISNQTSFAKVISSTPYYLLPDFSAGCILICDTSTQDVEIRLGDFGNLSTASIVKVGNNKVKFTGTTINGDSEITGKEGSSASIVMYHGTAIININNK